MSIARRICAELDSQGGQHREMLGFMPQLIVVEKIDGNPVAWRCSECRQTFSARGKLTMEERHRKVAGDFKIHMEECHKAQGAVAGLGFRLVQRLRD
jgi:hypothetical protein